MKRLLIGFLTLLSLSAFAQEGFNVANKIKIPKRFLKQDSALLKASLVSDGVEEVKGFIVINNPRLKLKGEYKGLKELPIASRNVTVDALCGLLGLGYWEMTPESPFEEKKWEGTPKSERIAVLLTGSTVSSFILNPFEEYDHDGIIKKLACKLHE